MEAHRSLSKKIISLIQKIKQKLSDSLEYDENGNDFLSCYNQYLITYVLNQGFTKHYYYHWFTEIEDLNINLKTGELFSKKMVLKRILYRII